MSVYEHHLHDNIGESSDKEKQMREAVLRSAEKHFTVEEYSELMAAMSDGQLDVRIYDDGIVLMRQF
jgi:hypothetical protein